MENIGLAIKPTNFLGAPEEAINILRHHNWLFRTLAFGMVQQTNETHIPLGEMRIQNAKHYDEAFVAAAINLVCTAPNATDFECSKSGTMIMGAYSIQWRIEFNKSWAEIRDIEGFDFGSIVRTLIITFPSQN